MTELYAQPKHVENIDDCVFYHVMDIPGVGIVGNDVETRNGWDLRGGVDDYLGRVDLNGKRVLEIGPASGFLSFEMEARGAEVVSVELGPDSEWDVVPHRLIDRDAIVAERLSTMNILRNGYWFAHERFKSQARVHYGNGRELPDELGHFDVALLGAVMLHNRDSLRMMNQCAALADCLIVTERHYPELDGSPIARLYPTPESPQWDTWWEFSPDLFVQFARILGYTKIEVTFHEQTHIYPHGTGQMPMFTVVAT